MNSPSLRRLAGLAAFAAAAMVAAGAVAVLALGTMRAGAWQETLAARSPAFALLLAPAGFALLAWITRVAFPGAQGGGVPQTLAMLRAPEGPLLLSLRIAAGKVALTIAGFAFGASIGREGPGIQIGASILHATRGFRAIAPRTLILAGASAGVAATFNAPAAALVFAFEQMARRVEWRALPAVVAAVAIATAASRGLLGDRPYFGHAELAFAGGREWLTVIACGIAGGVVGGGFSRGLVGAQALLLSQLRERPVRTAAALGFVVGALGFLAPGTVQGTGYEATHALLQGDALRSALDPFAKLLATLLSSLAAIPGGLFSPSLAVGAGLGAALAPWLGASGMCATLGMAAYLAGVTRAPLTATVIVVEMLAAPQLALPLLATTLLAFAASRLLSRESVYEGMLRNL